MTKQISLVLTILIVAFTSLCSCEKRDTKCFDEELYLQSKNSPCTFDCPGVTGCDGKFYCNECEANRYGIRVEK